MLGNLLRYFDFYFDHHIFYWSTQPLYIFAALFVLQFPYC
jgi:hypothetical protein